MRRTTIGGVLDYAALVGNRDQHRPKSRDEMRCAVAELARRGWSDHTIAASVGLAVEQVRRLLGEHRT